MYVIIDHYAGELPVEFETEAEAFAYLEADEYYHPGDMSISVERKDS